jgi:hypothetical protein
MFWPILTIDFFVPRHFFWNKKQITEKNVDMKFLSTVVMDFVEPSDIISLFRYRYQSNEFSNGQFGHCLGQSGHFGQNIWCAYQVGRKMVEVNIGSIAIILV